jgi:hypothetical protein
MAAPETSTKENEFEKLRAPIQEIIAFTDSLDLKYQEKCFEVLLNFYLHKNIVSASLPAQSPNGARGEPVVGTSNLPLPIQGYLKTNNVPLEVVNQLFLIANGEVVPTYKLKEGRRATAQIQLALLSAFRNALVNATTMFEFSIEDIRALCKEHNVYDGGNFLPNFKNNGSLFKDFPGDEKHVKLTPEGKTELGKVLIAVSTQ